MQSSEHVITSKHYLVLCVIAFAAGIFFCVNFSISLSLSVCILLFLVLFSFLITFVIIPIFRKGSIKPKKYILLPSVLIIFFILGIFRTVLFENTSARVLRDYSGENVRLYGYVNSVPRQTSNGFSYSFDLNVSCIESRGKIIHTNGTVMMYINNDSVKNLKFSEHISCWASLEDAQYNAFPDNYDYINFLKSKNVFIIGKSKGYTITPPLAEKKPSIIDHVKEAGIFVHEKIAFAIDNLFSYDRNDKALLKGILIGDKADMTDEFKQQLSNAGISHIAAVSGMHMSLLFAAITFLLSQLRINRKVSLVIAIPMILLFASTAAFTPSVCRSAIMITIVILSSLTKERYSPITSLFTAIGIILVFSPYALFSSGFVLSCFSVLSIFTYFKYLKNLFKYIIPNTVFFSPLLNSLALSLSIFIGTAYFSVMFFDSVSLIQCITNLWVIPLVSVVFCIAYPLCIASFFLPDFIIRPVLYLVAGALRIISQTAHIFGKDMFTYKFPAQSVPGYFHAIYFGSAVLLYFLLKYLYDFQAKEKRSKNPTVKTR